MAERLLQEFDGVAGLAQASFDELCQQHGVGEAKAAQIKAALELGKAAGGCAPAGATPGAQPGRRGESV